jgi:bzd-type benzoyl-CoA reductase Q subunit
VDPTTHPGATTSDRQESWRWEERSWRDPSLDWRRGEILSAGVDVGSVSSQAVVLVDGKLLAWASMRTGASSPDSARRAMSRALEETGLGVEGLHFVVGTGYGRVNVPFAHRAITEIHCHARGAHFMYGDRVRTLLDMGGQDCKAIRCDHRGKVVSFQMNDKCAAGTGRGMEVFADLLQIPISEVGPLSLSVAEEPPPVSSTCVVFAKSEAAGLLRKGWPKERVLAAYCSAMAHRVHALLERVGIEREFAITGGIAKNPGVVRRIERAIGFESVKSPLDAQIAGALGGALFGHALELKKRGG